MYHDQNASDFYDRNHRKIRHKNHDHTYWKNKCYDRTNVNSGADITIITIVIPDTKRDIMLWQT